MSIPDHSPKNCSVSVAMAGPHIAIVTLQRPEARNAINVALATNLAVAVNQVEEDHKIRVVILTGAGDKAFCAGADLREVAAGKLAEQFTEKGGFAGFVLAPRKKPWIAAVNGVALAGGCEIALACDLIVAVEGARFGLPEVTRGLIASAGGLYRLPRALPKALALELIITGQPISAPRAYTLGLINRLVTANELMPEAMRIAETIAANAPLAVRASLELARRAAWFDDDNLSRAGDEVQSKLAQSFDYKEGATAFMEKRQPRFRGA